MSNLLSQYTTLKKSVEDFVEEHKDVLVSEVLKQAFQENPEVDYFMVTGYTPSFNDGDACTHTMYVVTDAGELHENCQDTESFMLALMPNYCEDDDLYEVFEEFELKDVGYEVWNAVDDTLTPFTDLLEEVLGSGWKILAVRDGENVKFEIEDYDCGY